MTVTEAPLPVSTATPTFAGWPSTATTLRASPSASVSLPSTPGAAALSTVASSVLPASSSAATGVSLTATTLTLRAVGAPVALSESVRVKLTVRVAGFGFSLRLR